ncbi:MAG TPA: methionyl-tRNA formyltransferase [Verrucomicrobiae bacterium]|jgi:methionyl-tRNA formyltransferase|nr:methionyl-tRNA formyltransferase [Verrucomicrobiae bacterium]
MNIIFMGTAELSCASLERLAGNQQFTIPAVVSQPDKPRGRDLNLQPPAVKVLAQKLGLPVLQPPRARDEGFIAELRALKPDLIVVAAYGHILPQAILDLPPLGCLNVHTSLLPKYRGAAPIQWAIADGESQTGVTIMKMDAGMDTGGILAQKPTPILPEDDSASLHNRLAQLGADLLVETIPAYATGKIQARPQPEGATYAPKIKKEDGHIDWNLPAQTILNRMRAFRPWPGAFIFLKRGPKSLLLKIWEADVVEEKGPASQVLSADESGIVVACGEKALRVTELQLEGGRRLRAREFLTGHCLKVGEGLR